MRSLGLTLLIILLTVINAEAHVRTVVPKWDQIIEIHTAVGIATMIETPLPVLPAISGDQSGFRIEYLDKSTIVKPLRPGAKTNLFLVTDKRRYNVRLSTVVESASDYVVYLKDSSAKASTRWHIVNREVSNDRFKLRLLRVGLTSAGTVILDLRLRAFAKESMKPADLWVLQKASSKTIDALFISDLEIGPKDEVSIGLAIAKTDLQPHFPLLIQLRFKEELLIQVPASVLWN
jgi:hypothetical protein